MEASPEKQTEFDRGVESGRVARELEEHNAHFQRINGSIERFATAMEALALAINSLQEKAEASRERTDRSAEATHESNARNWRNLQKRHATALYALGLLLLALIAVGVVLAVLG